jgi:ketosteroid isomerase-like protein
MARENAELIREVCATWSRGELNDTLGFIHPDVRWEPSGKFIGSGRMYRGHRGVQEFWSLFREPWESISLEPVEFTEVDGTRMLTRTRFRGMGRTSGVVTEAELFVVWTIENGTLTRYQSFADRTEALEAAGLSE